MDQKYLTDSESLSLNIEATCLLLSSPRNLQYEIKTDKYHPYPSMISMFTSDSQHPPKFRHAVHLVDMGLDARGCTQTTFKPVSSVSETSQKIVNSTCSKYRFDTFQKADHAGTDQSAGMRRLICAFNESRPN